MEINDTVKLDELQFTVENAVSIHYLLVSDSELHQPQIQQHI